MRLGVALIGIAAIAVASVFAAQRLNNAEQYRQLVASGERALAAGNSYAAIEAFSGAIALRAGSMTAHLRRAEAYQAQRRLDDASRDFRTAAQLQPGATDPLVALAALYDGRGETAEAAEWYARAAAIDRQSPVLLYQLALSRYRSGQSAAASDPLRQAIALNPAFDEALYLLGVVLRDSQDPAGAIAALERAVQANPSLAPAREELADLYRTEKRFADEMTQLTALATLDPRADRDLAIALAQARRGAYAAAEATLRAAEERTPDDSPIALMLGRVHVMRAESATDRPTRDASARAAVTALERALGGTARRSEGLALFGRALYLSGDIDEAVRILRAAVATTPFSREAFLYLADAEAAAHNPLEAITWLRRFEALDGDGPARSGVSRRIGLLALQTGNYTEARSRLEPLLSAAPTDVTLLTATAEALWRTGNAEEARVALTEALRIAPRDPDARRLRSVIR